MDRFEPQDGEQGFPSQSNVPPGPADAPRPHIPYPTPGPAAVYPEESKAVVSLVLSILGLVLCGVLSPVGWYYGRQEIEAIDAGRRDPSKRDMATAGKIIGLIGTIFMGLVFLFLAVVILLAILGSVS